ncbi:unnamed protein product [Discula destructiva]
MTGNKKVVNDIFVFDPATEALLVVFLRAVFQGMPVKSLARTLARLNSDSGKEMNGAEKNPKPLPMRTLSGNTISAPGPPSSRSKPEAVDTANDVLQQVRQLFSRVIEVPIDEVKPSAALVNLGVDSLMSTEILNEIKAQFDVVVSSQQLLVLEDVKSVAQHLINGRAASSPSPACSQTSMTPISGSEVSRTQSNDAPSSQQVQVFLSKFLDIPMEEVVADTSLDKPGIDSLMATEVLNEIKQQYRVAISAEELQGIQDVSPSPVDIRGLAGTVTSASIIDDPTWSSNMNGHTNQAFESSNPESHPITAHTSVALVARDSFAGVKRQSDSICQQAKPDNFYERVYPTQKELVVAYLVEAFQAMGCRPDRVVSRRHGHWYCNTQPASEGETAYLRNLGGCSSR